ncbi:MAG: putative porin [Candidatus Brocadiia bacterium]
MRNLFFALLLVIVLAPRVAAAEDNKTAWAEKIKVYGDFRYRHEMIDEEGKDTRTRHRIRARIGVAVALSEEVNLDFRLATGGTDPVSTNQSLGEGFSTKTFDLDYAMFTYSPVGFKGFSILGGKVKSPYLVPGGSQLVWDGDLTPEGLAIKYAPSIGKATLTVALGTFWVEERKAAADELLTGAQVSVKVPFEKGASLTLGVSYYSYSGIQGRAPTVGASGNSVEGSWNYLFGYKIAEGLAEFAFSVKEFPLMVFGDYMSNSEADDNKKAYMVGFRVNKVRDPGSWEVTYNYRRVEKDAVLGQFCDSDFIGGGTNGTGHTVGLTYQVSKAASFGITYMLDKKGVTSGTDYKRLQVDVNFKF